MNQTEIHRRNLLRFAGSGIGATALVSLLGRDGQLVAADQLGSKGPFPSFLPRAKRAVHICLVGGMSHLDSFDFKPELDRYHGKRLDSQERPDIFFGKVGLLRKSDWKFHQRGQSGLRVSELFPRIADVADELTVINSMVAHSANHTPALFFENSGFGFNGYPAAGSWLSYGLGNENDNLPAYVVLPDLRGGPNGGASNWTAGFLPAEHQGVEFRGGDQPVRDLFPQRALPDNSDDDVRDFLAKVNRKHLARLGDDQLLRAKRQRLAGCTERRTRRPPTADNVVCWPVGCLNAEFASCKSFRVDRSAETPAPVGTLTRTFGRTTGWKQRRSINLSPHC